MNQHSSRGGPRFGCFTYGCGFALVLIVVVFGGLGFYYAKSLRSAFEEYSSDRAPSLPPFEVSAEVSTGAWSKFESLRSAVQQATSATATFTEPELNALIANSVARDAVRVSLAQDQLVIEFVFTPALLGDWQAARFILGSSYGRFFNGSASARTNVDSGVASVSFSELTLNGHRLEDMARGHASQWITGAINSSLGDGDEGAAQGGPLRFVRAMSIKNNALEVTVGPAT